MTITKLLFGIKYNVSLKTLLQHGKSELEVYGDLVASGPRMNLAGCKSALNPPLPLVVYSNGGSKAVVPALVLLFIVLWFLRSNLS